MVTREAAAPATNADRAPGAPAGRGAPGPGAGPAPGRGGWSDPDTGFDTGSRQLREVLERGRRVYTAVVVVLQLLVVVAALTGAALAPGGGSPSVVVGAALAAGWLALAVAHLVRGLPVPLLVLVGLVCAAALPPLVAAGTPVEEEGVLRVLPTTASAVLWLLAGTPGRVAPVLVRAVVVGAAALALASVSAGLVGLGRLDVVGPLVTALLAVASLLVAHGCAARAERSLAARRVAAVDLLVARELATARRRLDVRLHDIVLGSLATMVTADAARAPAVRELAAEALALLVAAGPDAADAPVRAPGRREPAEGAGRDVDAPTAPDQPLSALEAGLVRLVARAAETGLVVELRHEAAAQPGAAPVRAGDACSGAVRPAVPEPEPEPEVVEALLGAVGECLRNVERHAGTSSALLVWAAGPGSARVLVVDAGAGFDPAAVPAGSLGLARSVRGRLEDVGGSASVRSRPGRGTVVQVEAPLRPVRARGTSPAPRPGPRGCGA
ncbi:sensor histidine kinase [uncultured Pseudokineococcus sp.]|uniref:sensor histidine kinase n=1 Tax=uncultured Pseudokineococcus sp. TaxID=1642928 RepID=UPI0026125C60|nr:hypothetical protein [uncultured Pseudokineococcus sp.]